MEGGSPFKPDILKGKVALLTGGASGIGFEISLQFGKHGASVALMGRRNAVLDSAVSTLQSLGIPVISPPFLLQSISEFRPPRFFFLNKQHRWFSGVRHLPNPSLPSPVLL